MHWRSGIRRAASAGRLLPEPLWRRSVSGASLPRATWLVCLAGTAVPQRLMAIVRAHCAVESWWFEGLTFVFVVVNMGILASYRYDHTKVPVCMHSSAA